MSGRWERDIPKSILRMSMPDTALCVANMKADDGAETAGLDDSSTGIKPGVVCQPHPRDKKALGIHEAPNAMLVVSWHIST